MRPVATHDRGRLAEDVDVTLHFLLPRAREHREHILLRIESVSGTKRVVVRRGLRQIEQRMPDEARVRARATQQVGLERQNGRHTVRDPPELLHPAAMPRPDLRRDVIQDRRTGLRRGAREPEIEIRVVYRDDELGTTRLHLATYHAHEPDEVRQAGRDLDETHHGEVLEIGEQLDAFRGHAWSAQPEEARLRPARAQRPRDAGTVQVARWLTRREQDRRVAHVVSPASTGTTWPAARGRT